MTLCFDAVILSVFLSLTCTLHSSTIMKQPLKVTLSEEIAHPTVYHHLSQPSVNIQLNGLIKCREDSGAQMQLTQVTYPSLSWISPESAALRYLFTNMQSIWQDKCCPKVTPQLAAKTTRIILDRYIYGPVSQFLLRVRVSTYFRWAL